MDGEGGSDEAGDASPWVAVDVPVQMFRVGRLLVAAVPAEVTTMAGRRLREVVLVAAEAAEAAESAAAGPSDLEEGWEVIITGVANGYAGYVTTGEEYDAQRYEGASTLYGPHTLAAGLSLVHFSAQRESFLSMKFT
jgi:neutral ceramidase